jgi:hypothetical protein
LFDADDRPVQPVAARFECDRLRLGRMPHVE